jgi:hypothetical protein
MEKINWKTMSGSYIPVNEMDTVHIRNTYNCLKNKSTTKIPSMWCGRSHQEWCKIFEDELDKRNFELQLSHKDKYMLVYKRR